jgi:hypothetical protein
MTEDFLIKDLRRMPGLFRRWELPSLFQLRRLYRIEDAGEHTDGTPLLALYTDAPVTDADPNAPRSSPRGRDSRVSQSAAREGV